VNIKLENRYAATWCKYESNSARAWIRGSVYLNKKFHRSDNASSLFSTIETVWGNEHVADISNFLAQLNGFFAIVVQRGQNCFAAVDRVRSIPLFYGQVNGQIFLSDDAEYIRKSVGDIEIDPLARQEFLFTGYVTGNETLFPNVRQLQAGECLWINQNENGQELTTHRYYRFLHTEPTGSNDDETLLNELDAVSEKCVQRLIDYADGRQIVVPLSAGYDSRLIVSLLRRLGYENVLTFSYGKPDNHESRISKAVAESLNYPWEFVKYNNSLWRRWWNTKERVDHQWWASEWTSLPHIQDWPAVWQLKEAGKLKQNAVFAPGHTGDVISGSHLPKNIEPEGNVSLIDLCQAIVSLHYSLMPWNSDSLHRLNEWHDRIIKCTEAPDLKKGNDLANWFEKWEWQERQAKFVINSVRAYEFWGYDWYLPLWDREFMLFWQTIPLCLRKGQLLHSQMVKKFHNHQSIPFGTKPANQVNSKINPTAPIRDMIKKSFIGLYLMPASRFYRSLKKYYMQPLGWYGIHSLGYYIKVRPIQINSVLALQYFPDTAEFIKRKSYKNKHARD